MLTTFFYNHGKIETNLSRPQMFSVLAKKEGLLWLDLENPTEFEEEVLIELFNFHPLAVEDCLSDSQHPKVDDYQEYLYLVVHSPQVTRADGGKKDVLGTKELDLFLGPNFVVTFHRVPIETIVQIRQNITKSSERLMGHGSDLLVYSLLDQLVDSYQPILDLYEDKMDMLEAEAFDHPDKNYLPTVIQMKRDIFQLRRVIAPQRDALNFLSRNTNPLIRLEHMMYFRDVYDHLFRIYGSVEAFQENMNSLLQAYFSFSSNKLNEIMKRMTVLATLTMPSVIIAGIYGMNFKHIPELQWQHGYYFSYALMAATSISMLIWMKWKKWI